MLKDSDIARHTARRTHRTYTPAFKAELVAACQQPGTSIAALAASHGMNANVLHRWLKEHARTGCHHPIASQQLREPDPLPSVSEFIALRLSSVTPDAVATELKIEMRKGALLMTVSWPIHAAADFAHFAQWAAVVLK
ncbi:transposase [Acidovorax sp. A1169]|uniref:transposase n=1 Tax=Acidovorax sp. A1169 TaxID=3059524 RepID=UPI002737F0BA|nr:transposase [Acidovorax sp. A1169]MDP4079002.1 transposase [Acidovorax sp. A1169]